MSCSILSYLKLNFCFVFFETKETNKTKMCGIFACIGQISADQAQRNVLALNKLQARGPDCTLSEQVSDRLWYGFTRLSINGLNSISNQPMHLHDYTLMCNGEIYNCHYLQKSYEFQYFSSSDCESILHLYHKFGFVESLYRLTGVFSIILHDAKRNLLHVANDRIGIRPLYWGYRGSLLPLAGTAGYNFFFASEPSALQEAGCTFIKFFPPGHYCILDLNKELEPVKLEDGWGLPGEFKEYYPYNWPIQVSLQTSSLEEIYKNIRFYLERAVELRMMSDRPIATLLSGGLDSSLISAIVAHQFRKTGTELTQTAKYTPELIKQQQMSAGRLNTFSIGLTGSPDLKYAKIVADHIGSTHHSIECTEEQFLAAIPEVVRAIQSWDITTVRASVGNYLVGKYIKEHTDFKVIFNGDVSEEVNASYYYSRFAPSPEAFHQDNIKLMREVHQYDVLRSARCLESHGLEPRSPFADQNFVNYMMSIDPTLKMVGENYYPIEKYLMRKAYEGTGLLPDEVLWRPKVAFSDGVSESGRSWFVVIREHIESLISDSEFEEGKLKYAYHCPPTTKEAYYYRKLFEEILPGHAKMITGYWMPRFVDGITDPSARVLVGNKT